MRVEGDRLCKLDRDIMLALIGERKGIGDADLDILGRQ